MGPEIAATISERDGDTFRGLGEAAGIGLHGDHRQAEGRLSEEVDLVVVHDHKLADEIVKALKQAGIPNVDFWPEQMLRPSRAYSGALLMRGFFRAKKVPDEGFGPFHIRVPGEWYHDAHVALMKSGLTEG